MNVLEPAFAVSKGKIRFNYLVVRRYTTEERGEKNESFIY